MLARRRGRRPRDPLGSYRQALQAIEAREAELSRLDDGALRERAVAMRSLLQADTPLDELLIAGLAVVREVARRTVRMRPHDAQIAAGIALHQGRVVEMATGEGKTLAAVGPVFLAAVAGLGAHVLTFNDYLARRDGAWMGPIYRLLGLEVGVIQEGMSVGQRRRAYACDVTYATAKEVGFDLLRDGLCMDPAQQVHRGFHFALVDEADSLLVDEARIPLVIAGTSAADELPVSRIAELARRLVAGIDFATDEHAHNVFLTDAGVARAEAELGVANLFIEEHAGLVATLRNALHAEHLLRRDVDYIVRGGTVELVDEHTGRVAESRHWPDGLQAAVEAKEGLRLGSDGTILASITLQHFLRLYRHLCGMTATAASAADELRDVYELDVTIIPPHRPCLRVDHDDVLFSHCEARDEALIQEVLDAHGAGRPVLVGTVSVVESERLAEELRRRGIACAVLNARNDEQEAVIIAEAGDVGAVTISTNMAGRGTDIRLGGRDESSREQILSLGGLYVIGTNRHASVRIDRQLRGRAGRQGDPGSSRFFISLEDDLMQRYGIASLIPGKLLPGRIQSPIGSPLVGREVARAQRIVEGESFAVRKRVYEYADVIERQRRFIQEWRQEALEDRADLTLLEERAGACWRRLREAVGEDVLRDVERHLTLLVIDRCWGEYLGELQALRDEIHLVSLDGRTPLVEFQRVAIAGFESLLEHVDEEIVEIFESLEVTTSGVDWEAHGLRGPSATWTYLVSDAVFGPNVMRTLAHRASIGILGTLVLWPVLLAWGVWEHWRRRSASRQAPRA